MGGGTRRSRPRARGAEAAGAPRRSRGVTTALWLALGAALVALGVAVGQDRGPPAAPPALPAAPLPAAPLPAAPMPAAPPPSSRRPAPPDVERLRVQVVRSFPHATDAFTQGLLVHDGGLYESTGLYGRSRLRRLRPSDGSVEAEVALDPDLFGEGLARVDDHLVQLTWQEGVALVWEAATLRLVDRHRYDGEGWGLCHDGRRLVMSDGSDRLVFRDPSDFRVLGGVDVRLEGRPVFRLNELECAGGAIYANVWMEDHVLRIDPRDGRVTAVVDASALAPPGRRDRADAVLNGIAHVPGTDRFYLTGKLWDRVYEVAFVPR